jgi:hypothetical protein
MVAMPVTRSPGARGLGSSRARRRGRSAFRWGQSSKCLALVSQFDCDRPCELNRPLQEPAFHREKSLPPADKVIPTKQFRAGKVLCSDASLFMFKI